MEGTELFNSIAQKCPAKRVTSLCEKLAKKCSFKSYKDLYNLKDLCYWLYAFDRKDLAMECIALTKQEQWRENNATVWGAIHIMWGLEIRILRESGNEESIAGIRSAIDHHMLAGKTFPKKEYARRARITYPEVKEEYRIATYLSQERPVWANDARLKALSALIGYTETGLFPNLNAHWEEIQSDVKEYISELAKEKDGKPKMAAKDKALNQVPEQPEKKPVLVVKIPKKFRDICELIRDGKMEEGLEKLDAFPGLEPQKSAVLAEIAYFEGRWDDGLDHDMGVSSSFGEWHYGNVSSEHMAAMIFAAKKTGRKEELVLLLCRLIEELEKDSFTPAHITKTRINGLTNRIDLLHNPKQKDGKEVYTPVEKPVPLAELRKQAAIKYPKYAPDSPEGRRRVLPMALTQATVEDFLSMYEEMADENLSTMWHIEALAAYNYINDPNKGLEVVLRMARQRLWLVASATQVRPMEFFTHTSVIPYLSDKDMLRKINEAAQRIH